MISLGYQRTMLLLTEGSSTTRDYIDTRELLLSQQLTKTQNALIYAIIFNNISSSGHFLEYHRNNGSFIN